MGQAEIIKLLKEEKKWLSSKQIAEKLGNSTAMRPLQVLLKHGEILRREVKVNSHNEYQWRIK